MRRLKKGRGATLISCLMKRMKGIRENWRMLLMKQTTNKRFVRIIEVSELKKALKKMKQVRLGPDIVPIEVWTLEVLGGFGLRLAN